MVPGASICIEAPGETSQELESQMTKAVLVRGRGIAITILFIAVWFVLPQFVAPPSSSNELNQLIETAPDLLAIGASELESSYICNSDGFAVNEASEPVVEDANAGDLTPVRCI